MQFLPEGVNSPFHTVLYMHNHSTKLMGFFFVGEGILPYLPRLMEKLLVALSPSTVSFFY